MIFTMTQRLGEKHIHSCGHGVVFVAIGIQARPLLFGTALEPHPLHCIYVRTHIHTRASLLAWRAEDTTAAA